MGRIESVKGTTPLVAGCPGLSVPLSVTRPGLENSIGVNSLYEPAPPVSFLLALGVASSFQAEPRQDKHGHLLIAWAVLAGSRFWHDPGAYFLCCSGVIGLGVSAAATELRYFFSIYGRTVVSTAPISLRIQYAPLGERIRLS